MRLWLGKGLGTGAIVPPNGRPPYGNGWAGADTLAHKRRQTWLAYIPGISLPPTLMTPPTLQNKVFLLLLALVTIAFGAILWQFHGAVFWGVILAILFAPLHRKLLRRMPRRRNLAALCTLGLCLIVVILPMTAITVSLAQEATVIYERMRSGQLNFGLYLQQVIAALPAWAANLLDRLNLTTVGELQQKFSSVAVQASQFVATQALSIGQNTLQFIVSFGIMLYLLFFLLRDGSSLALRIGQATPWTKRTSGNWSASSPPSFAPRSKATLSWRPPRERWAV